ncbi:hypothetical protein [Agrococcus sp. ARC_14]|uniref:hypothetical protein n=1 Tax=Agrococcus sp. ARC_14 TaxID=2919927 RepID=UPI001F053C66|nr:hypothetical protein [Agrococcus sp. ARC_14]MCH1883370.1 hypothetical protein [Agrococcus sp. ARC_14]
MLVVAAALVALLGIAHSILGEVAIIRPMERQTQLPKLRGADFPLNTIRFAWHVTSLLALGFAVVLLQLASGIPPHAVVAAIGWTLLACSVLPLVWSRGRHPSWIIFIIAGALCLLSAAGIAWQ